MNLLKLIAPLVHQSFKLPLFTFCCLLNLTLNSDLSASVTIHNYVQPFIDEFHELSDPTPSACERYILGYEFKYGTELEASFFSKTDLKKRERALQGIDSYAKNLRDLVKSYQVTLPEVIATLNATEKQFATFANEVNKKNKASNELNAHVYLFSTLVNTDAVARGLLSNSFSLNFRQIASYSKEAREVVISHELFHLLQGQWMDQLKEAEPNPIPGGLFSEGWATYASSVVFAGKPDWKYVSYFKESDDQFLKFERDRNDILKSLLKDWDTQDPQVSKKYFSGDSKDSGSFEPRSGYYIGYVLAKKIAENRGAKQTLRLSYSEFLKIAKPVLSSLMK